MTNKHTGRCVEGSSAMTYKHTGRCVEGSSAMTNKHTGRCVEGSSAMTNKHTGRCGAGRGVGVRGMKLFTTTTVIALLYCCAANGAGPSNEAPPASRDLPIKSVHQSTPLVAPHKIQLNTVQSTHESKPLGKGGGARPKPGNDYKRFDEAEANCVNIHDKPVTGHTGSVSSAGSGSTVHSSGTELITNLESAAGALNPAQHLQQHVYARRHNVELPNEVQQNSQQYGEHTPQPLPAPQPQRYNVGASDGDTQQQQLIMEPTTYGTLHGRTSKNWLLYQQLHSGDAFQNVPQRRPQNVMQRVTPCGVTCTNNLRGGSHKADAMPVVNGGDSAGDVTTLQLHGSPTTPPFYSA